MSREKYKKENGLVDDGKAQNNGNGISMKDDTAAGFLKETEYFDQDSQQQVSNDGIVV